MLHQSTSSGLKSQYYQAFVVNMMMHQQVKSTGFPYTNKALSTSGFRTGSMIITPVIMIPSPMRTPRQVSIHKIPVKPLHPFRPFLHPCYIRNHLLHRTEKLSGREDDKGCGIQISSPIFLRPGPGELLHRSKADSHTVAPYISLPLDGKNGLCIGATPEKGVEGVGKSISIYRK